RSTEAVVSAMKMAENRKTRFGFGLLALMAMMNIGCGRPAGIIFPPLEKPIIWPQAPEKPRIKYVGQLVTSDDLKPAIPFGQGLGEAIFGKKPARSMLTPYAICTDGKDRVFVADSGAQLVHVFNLNTRLYEQWKPPEPIRFSQPVGIAWDPAGRLYVADSVSGRIFMFDTSGRMTGLIGSSMVVRPCGLAFDPKSRRLFVADPGTHQLRVFSSDGRPLASIGSRGIELGQFNFPTNVAVDSQGLIYVADSLNFRVQQFAPALKPIRQIGRKGDMPGYFGQPKGLAIDSQEHLYAVDAHFEAVQIFDHGGNLLMDFGQEGSNPGEFWLPAGIFVDSHNRIWVADSYNRRVQVFDYLPEVQQ
ncbi:MAG TPA: hypothetical protein VHD56_07620, partial [Tepidisphaeraceae bacterium]|nr:hypothetical protein [Tepidisphaeraceae bacterium]